MLHFWSLHVLLWCILSGHETNQIWNERISVGKHLPASYLYVWWLQALLLYMYMCYWWKQVCVIYVVQSTLQMIVQLNTFFFKSVDLFFFKSWRPVLTCFVKTQELAFFPQQWVDLGLSWTVTVGVLLEILSSFLYARIYGGTQYILQIISTYKWEFLNRLNDGLPKAFPNGWIKA